MNPASAWLQCNSKPVFLPPPIEERSFQKLVESVMHDEGEVAISIDQVFIENGRIVAVGIPDGHSFPTDLKRMSAQQVPFDVFGVHSHPLVAYCTALCNVGYPSGNDLQVWWSSHFQSDRVVPMFNYVITLEGVYIVKVAQTSEDTYKFAKRHSDELADAIFQYGSGLHNARSTMHSSAHMTVSPIEWCKIISNLTYGDLTTCRRTVISTPVNYREEAWDIATVGYENCKKGHLLDRVFRVWFYPNLIELKTHMYTGLNFWKAYDKLSVNRQCKMQGAEIRIAGTLPQLMWSETCYCPLAFMERCRAKTRSMNVADEWPTNINEFSRVKNMGLKFGEAISRMRDVNVHSIFEDAMYAYIVSAALFMKRRSMDRLHQRGLRLDRFHFADYAFDIRSRKWKFLYPHEVDAGGVKVHVHCAAPDSLPLFKRVAVQLVSIARVLRPHFPELSLFLDGNFSVKELFFGPEYIVVAASKQFHREMRRNTDIVAMAKPCPQHTVFKCNVLHEYKQRMNRRRCPVESYFRQMYFSPSHVVNDDGSLNNRIIVHEIVHVIKKDAIWYPENHPSDFHSTESRCWELLRGHIV